MGDAKESGPPDLLYGLDAIATHLGLTVAQVKWQIAKSAWPTFKQGAIVCAQRSTLAQHFAAQEAAAHASGNSSANAADDTNQGGA